MGKPLNCALVTEHLPYSLPYRALFSKRMRSETVLRLIDSLAVLVGNDYILADSIGETVHYQILYFAETQVLSQLIVVDAETGELHEKLSDGQRNYDLDLARTNVIGELMDLQGSSNN